MTPQGYADGLTKPATQVRAQKNLVKKVPGSNLPKEPIRVKRVKQSVAQQLEEQQVKQAQQAYLPSGGSVGPIREVQSMKGLSGMNRSIDFDKAFKAREQAAKITEQASKLHRGRAVGDAMREAEELGHSYSAAPWWKQDLTREQVNKRRHALKDLVRTNRDPRQNVDDHFPQGMDRRIVHLRDVGGDFVGRGSAATSAHASRHSMAQTAPDAASSRGRGILERRPVSERGRGELQRRRRGPRQAPRSVAASGPARAHRQLQGRDTLGTL